MSFHVGFKSLFMVFLIHSMSSSHFAYLKKQLGYIESLAQQSSALEIDLPPTKKLCSSYSIIPIFF